MNALDNLSLSKKFLLLMVCLLLPSAFLLFKLVSSSYQVTAAIEFESQGARFVHALAKLSLALADHRGTSYRYLGGDKTLSADMTQLTQGVDAAFKSVDSVSTERASAWIESAEWKTVLTTWRDIKQKLAAGSLTAPDSITLHTDAITSLDALSKQVVVSTELALDSDAVSHALIDAAILQLPYAQTELFDLRRRAVGAADQLRQLDAATRTTLNVAGQRVVPPTPAVILSNRTNVTAGASIVRNRTATILGILKEILKSRPELAFDIQPSIDAYSRAVATFAEMSNDKVGLADTLQVEIAAIFTAAERSYKSAGALQDALMSVLLTQFKVRVEREHRQLYLALATYLTLLAGTLLLERRLRCRITAGVQSLLTAIGSMSEGKIGLALHSQSNDEFGQIIGALARLDTKLAQVLASIRHSTSSVTVAARELNQGNDDLSGRTQEQAAVLEETAASMEEMTSTVKQNADNAFEANQLANGACQHAERGSSVAARAIDAMSAINGSSSKIAEIIGVIDSIAFQTNLLALNAAVEAARAGEQGRGFAVVATEVRNLAQRSAVAAREIKDLINESAQLVHAGSKLVDESGQALADILQSVRKVTDYVAAIAAASKEQATGIEQVNSAVVRMDGVTQHNAALVEEASAASKAVVGSIENLLAEIAFFQTDRPTDASAGDVSLLDRWMPAQAEQFLSDRDLQSDIDDNVTAFRPVRKAR
jgi:methyl-accepting chemotaxis protein